MFEQFLGGELNPCLPRSADHLQGNDRVAAQLEEVVGQPHLVQFQYVRPDRCNRSLQVRLRFDVGLLQQAGIRLWKGLAVQFAIR
ncbi:hypothetical protein D3C79_1050550 [compost metagenome]